MLNVSLPFITLTIPAYASNARLIVFVNGLVLIILQSSCFSEVLPSIVMANTITVVDLTIWKVTSHIQPSKKVRPIEPPVNTDPVIARRLVDVSSNVTDLAALRCPGQTGEYACQRIVVEQFP